MRNMTGLLLLALVSAPALAWVPTLDQNTAKNVLDAAYNRGPQVNTLLTVDLAVKDGQFASGPDSVSAFEGGAQCVADWLASPSDYSAGSRPLSVTLTGQADQLFLQAQQARDQFRNISTVEAVKNFDNGLWPDPITASSQTTTTQSGNTTTSTTTTTVSNPHDKGTPLLASGQLKVYVQMNGLASDQQRDAYDVALKAPDGKIVRPFKRAYTNDWKQGAGGLWGGTMVYYFDAIKNGVPPNGKVDVLIRTEADTNCAYAVPVDLGKFN